MVVVDLDPERVAEVPHPALIGDVTDDDVLREAGIMRATALVAAINTEEVTVRAGSRLAGRTLREANAGETTGALVLALRGRDGTFLANPLMQTPIDAGCMLIAIGNQQQLPPCSTPRIKSVEPGTTPRRSTAAALRRSRAVAGAAAAAT